LAVEQHISLHRSISNGWILYVPSS
jgi:hypothetical protein